MRLLYKRFTRRNVVAMRIVYLFRTQNCSSNPLSSYQNLPRPQSVDSYYSCRRRPRSQPLIEGLTFNDDVSSNKPYVADWCHWYVTIKHSKKRTDEFEAKRHVNAMTEDTDAASQPTSPGGTEPGAEVTDTEDGGGNR